MNVGCTPGWQTGDNAAAWAGGARVWDLLRARNLYWRGGRATRPRPGRSARFARSHCDVNGIRLDFGTQIGDDDMALMEDATPVTEGASEGAARNARLKSAVHRHKATSREGISERVFTALFSGLVYPQIWEDPVVDLEAMALKPDEHVVAIMSGGCNILSYITAAPVRITAVDLNPAHVALNKLKQCAAVKLPDYAAFHKFFAEADSAGNVPTYDDHLKPHLDAVSRAYWESRDALGRRRIGYFTQNVYRHGLLGRFIGAGHALARMHGTNLRNLLRAKNRGEQRAIFEREIAPLFKKAHIRWLCERPSALFGLGIPPAQFEALKGREKYMADVLYKRLERLACDFDFSDNYFAWQAFGRRYASGGAGPLPLYLQRDKFETLRARAPSLEILHRSFTEYLASQPAGSCDAFVLLDAQDWMTDQQLNELWSEIARTSKPGSRVIFRTAGEDTILPGRVADAVLSRFSYDEARCREMTLRDRSSIYGGFHLYVFQG
jgi:S-adenosylmethionine-diacylglycerol 3-amino-3-carboxypropyl transferase